MMCKNCHQPPEKHFVDPQYAWLTRPIWCNENARDTAKTVRREQTHMGGAFFKILIEVASWLPMDNLDYIEHEAKRRKLI